MLKEERLQKILDILENDEGVTAERLSQTFFVSLPTIYRDLRELTRRRLIVHSEGVIQKASDQVYTTPLNARHNRQAASKASIARAASRLLRDGSVVFIDASTTASYLIDILPEYRDLTVLTNGLITAMLLKQAGVRTFCLGGALLENSLAVGGRIAMDIVKDFRIDLMFFSSYGVTEGGVIVDPSEKETSLRRYILQRAAVSVFLCDESKFGKRSLFNVAPLSDVDYLVTDAAEVDDIRFQVKRQIIQVDRLIPL